MAYNKQEIPIKTMSDGLQYFTKENKFESEKEFTKHLLPNLEQLIKRIYNLDVTEIRQEQVYNMKKFDLPSMQADIVCKTKQGVSFIIECKNPTNNYGQLNLSIAQMLNYQMIIENLNGEYKLILATSMYHFYLLKVIKRFGLNHDVLLHNKLTTAIILKEDL
jgi:hypothetical protein